MAQAAVGGDDRSGVRQKWARLFRVGHHSVGENEYALAIVRHIALLMGEVSTIYGIAPAAGAPR